MLGKFNFFVSLYGATSRHWKLFIIPATCCPKPINFRQGRLAPSQPLIEGELKRRPQLSKRLEKANRDA